ncbi:Ig-like domain-containing protein, partial [Spirochaetota bacterium]
MKKLLCIFFLMLIISCSKIFDVKAPYVKETEPVHESEDVDVRTAITIIFSETMNSLTVEKGVSLTYGTETAAGDITWDGAETLVFTPKNDLYTGMDYIFNVSQEAEDEKGNNLLNDFVFYFTTGGDSGRPVIMGTYPQDRSTGNPQINSMYVNFNTEIDIASFKDSFLFSPHENYIVSASADKKRFYVQFSKMLSYNVKYYVTIRSGLKGLNGKTMLDTYHAYFYIGDDYAPVELLSVATSSNIALSNDMTSQGIEKDETVIFEFNKTMEKISVENGISITPHLDGTFSWQGGSICTFSPLYNMQIETTYTVFISKSCSDSYNNTMDDDFTAYFMVNGPASQYVMLTNVATNGGSISQNHMLSFTNWLFYGFEFTFAGEMETIYLIDNIDIIKETGTGGSGITIE